MPKPQKPFSQNPLFQQAHAVSEPQRAVHFVQDTQMLVVTLETRAQEYQRLAAETAYAPDARHYGEMGETHQDIANELRMLLEKHFGV